MNVNDFVFLKGAKKKHPTKDIELEYLDKSNAVALVVFDSKKENVYLVKQYRPGSNDYQIEVVAGLIDDGENEDMAALRELKEELGIKKEDIKSFKKIPQFYYVIPSYSTEKMYFYEVILNEDAIFHKQELDETEDIEIVKMSVDEALDKIVDLKSAFLIEYFK
ncbi:NUDIX hydrolase [Oceanivirga miroungae]|uniref:NUDIX hydrolase n=1 Tax=Oceanivirga miroungae TaxID=1130046 RepID=A0A6I8MDY2_9FUSO|nr:NUDIX hydrolase [Oceanivirga miroungae]VWL85757.1 NUDIX hydrolase [Oceanivirga miroungae]